MGYSSEVQCVLSVFLDSIPSTKKQQRNIPSKHYIYTKVNKGWSS